MLTVLSNAGPLMALGKLNRLDLLTELYEQVQIPRAVYTETVTQGLAYGANDALTIKIFWQHQNWPIIDVAEKVLAAYRPSVILDQGEIELLALAQTLSEYEPPLVLLDDEVARAEARRLHLRVRGTVGVLVEAYQQKQHSFNQINFLFQEIAERQDIWISNKLCQQVLKALPK
jgi:predicted nucleic acid-binding protein